MKETFFFFVIIFLCISTKAQNYYSYSKGQKVEIPVNTRYIFINSQTISNKDDLLKLIGDKFIVIKSKSNYSFKAVDPIDPTKSVKMSGLFWAVLMLVDSPVSNQDYQVVMNSLKTTSGIDYVAPSFNGGKNTAYLSHLFFVKTESSDDLAKLKSLAEETNTTILGTLKFMPNWYILTCNKNSKGNTLDMANYFYESGYFLATEPDLFGDVADFSCPTDPDFTNQWNLNNTGQQLSGMTGYDIHACDAWSLTTGSSEVIIGMVDNGPSLLHPDLSPNIVSNGGYDVENVSSPSVQYSTATTTSGSVEVNHGTGIAGILIAQQNSIGISGVAPNCQLYPISFSTADPGSKAYGASAISYAYLLPSNPDGGAGASVITNAWGWGDPGDPGYSSALASSVVNDAISNALAYGRPINGGANGYLGSVLVFSAGNQTSAPGLNTYTEGLAFPMETADTDIITVGATSICQERHRTWETSGSHPASCGDGYYNWNSDMGSALDIMAPGIDIYTTDNQSSTTPTAGTYMNDFSGTSAAAPQVAGVAALMLSLYPCLTQKQVSSIIEMSAQKISSAAVTYGYALTAGHSWGTWHHEMGYGMVDAYASVNWINNFSYLQAQDVTGTQKDYSLNFIKAGYDVNSALTLGDYTVDNTANVEIKAQQYILLEPGAKAVRGAVMYAHIASYTGDCTNWIPVMDKKSLAVSNDPINTDSIKVAKNTDNISNGITMLPNPFKQSFTVNFEVLTEGQNTSVKVYDLTGRLIYEHSAPESLGTHSYNIPVSSSASLYIVEACMGGNCITQKMIKYEMD